MTWLNIAKKYIGTKEVVGNKHNPTILKMYSSVGFPEVKDDETAWCAAFVGSVLKESGYPFMKSLAARSYLTYGKKLTEPKEGCIVVFWRGKPDGWQGHVAFVTKYDDKWVWALGGNQSNTVSEQKFDRKKVLGYRWPVEGKVEPTSVTKQVVKNSTKLSFLQKIRTTLTTLGVGVGSIFTLDTFNMGIDMVTSMKAFMVDNAALLLLGAIGLTWFILKWNEWKHIADFKEGRYIPSKMEEGKEVTDVSKPA